MRGTAIDVVNHHYCYRIHNSLENGDGADGVDSSAAGVADDACVWVVLVGRSWEQWGGGKRGGVGTESLIKPEDQVRIYAGVCAGHYFMVIPFSFSDRNGEKRDKQIMTPRPVPKIIGRMGMMCGAGW